MCYTMSIRPSGSHSASLLSLSDLWIVRARWLFAMCITRSSEIVHPSLCLVWQGTFHTGGICHCILYYVYFTQCVPHRQLTNDLRYSRHNSGDFHNQPAEGFDVHRFRRLTSWDAYLRTFNCIFNFLTTCTINVQWTASVQWQAFFVHLSKSILSVLL